MANQTLATLGVFVIFVYSSYCETIENMKALVIGTVGTIGKDLMEVLLNDPIYKKEILIDFNNLDDVSGYITGDVLFYCLGPKTAGSKEEQWAYSPE